MFEQKYNTYNSLVIGGICIVPLQQTNRYNRLSMIIDAYSSYERF